MVRYSTYTFKVEANAHLKRLHFFFSFFLNVEALRFKNLLLLNVGRRQEDWVYLVGT